ncbi:brachyurin-like [Neocloeon triangulifer]|uniref:brachyurin-like n=1 Tax=Neocloeon triangulifer TaxID=2078957 RepID=UPI00286F17B8|nr:brachyurin-like [Neocloeon triangulifer]
MQITLALVLLALVVQAAVGARQELNIKPKYFTLPQVKLSASQLTQLAEPNQPPIDNNSIPIVQPNNAGTSSSSGQSGVSKQIVGGYVAVLGQYPWQALLYIDNAGFCGGSIILPEWILTAAHCIGTVHDVILGSISQNPLSSGYVRLTSRVSFKHELYNSKTLVNDIGLIKLPSTVTFTGNISPVRLPIMADAARNMTDLMILVSGFGRTLDTSAYNNVLKFGRLRVVSYQTCASYYGTSTVTASNICTKQINSATCQGDDGGPLIYRDVDTNYLWTQFGIVSFSASAGCLEGYSVYTKVTSYLSWMSKKIGQDLTGTTTGQTVTSTVTTTQPTTTTTRPTTTKTTTKLTTTKTTPKTTKKSLGR